MTDAEQIAERVVKAVTDTIAKDGYTVASTRKGDMNPHLTAAVLNMGLREAVEQIHWGMAHDGCPFCTNALAALKGDTDG